MTNTKIEENTIAEIVADNYKTADVFKQHGIDFCCGGKKTVETVCEQKGIDFTTLSEELSAVFNEKKPTEDFNSWELDFLIDYIANTHHKYIESNVPLIQEYADKVARVHGHHYIEVVEIAHLFREISAELIPHMKKEELILFPNIKRMVVSIRNNEPVLPAPFGSIQNPINMMEAEHDGAGDIIKKIAELSNNFQPPAEACNTYRVLYAKLQEFQDDLFQHIHLENNILFPKAIELEKQG
ncbi:MAG: iron-sulfur cluster repair di-iron protein [Crocinitomicaceae bacterium]|nr:iron-sulfur cluster repair di-iron protein [Crocinitomicaceae bacterium]|tara:strand:- start:212 stop:934 length:723 start_codon:yes stop_codon:yes gene_type:complete